MQGARGRTSAPSFFPSPPAPLTPLLLPQSFGPSVNGAITSPIPERTRARAIRGRGGEPGSGGGGEPTEASAPVGDVPITCKIGGECRSGSDLRCAGSVLQRSGRILRCAGRFAVRAGRFAVRAGRFAVRAGRFLVCAGRFADCAGRFLVCAGRFADCAGRVLRRSGRLAGWSDRGSLRDFWSRLGRERRGTDGTGMMPVSFRELALEGGPEGDR
jgi:hypothetical protein